MTLKLAAFQHFCARFADAFLTSISPLTYERGDYQDLTEATDPDYEPAHICGPVMWSTGMDAWVCVECGVPQLRGFSGVSGATHDHAAGVEASPTPPAAFQLPMYDAKDLEAIAAEYIDKGYPDGSAEKSRLVAQLIISHLTFELQSLVYDQNNQK